VLWCIFLFVYLNAGKIFLIPTIGFPFRLASSLFFTTGLRCFWLFLLLLREEGQKENEAMAGICLKRFSAF